MSSEHRPFRYAVAPLHKQHGWEAERLAVDGARIRIVLDELRTRLQQTQTRVCGIVGELRALYEAPQGISLERRSTLQTYLDDQRALEFRQATEADQVEGRYEQIMTQLQAKRTQMKIIEKHRERKQCLHDQENLVRGFKSADEGWLRRKVGRR